MNTKETTLQQCGSNLRWLRVQAKKTQEELAYDLHTSQATISRIELGKDLPTQELLCRICDYFNVLPSDFFGDVTKAVMKRKEQPHEPKNYDMETKVDYFIQKLDLLIELMSKNIT